jgi:hypothetical protein
MRGEKHNAYYLKWREIVSQKRQQKANHEKKMKRIFWIRLPSIFIFLAGCNGKKKIEFACKFYRKKTNRKNKSVFFRFLTEFY